jgi:hypothetical protein
LSQRSQNENTRIPVDSMTQKQLREALKMLRPLSVSIEETPEAYLIKLQMEILGDPTALTRLYNQETERGGWSPRRSAITLPADSRLPTDPAERALDMLKGVFSHSEREIAESLKVLIQAGMGTKEISQVTGAGRSTIYRYLHLQSMDSQNEKATADQSAKPSACKSGSKQAYF